VTAQSTTETIAVGGLNAPAEIAIDCWGIPHLQASTRDDLFFVQGFNAARDRLWQIDLWRKRGLGLLAADFGPGYFAQITLRVPSFIAATWQPSGHPMPRGRAPYFHNGSAATLLDVVNFYNQRFNIGLTPAQTSDMAAFLQTL